MARAEKFRFIDQQVKLKEMRQEEKDKFNEELKDYSKKNWRQQYPHRYYYHLYS